MKLTPSDAITYDPVNVFKLYFFSFFPNFFFFSINFNNFLFVDNQKDNKKTKTLIRLIVLDKLVRFRDTFLKIEEHHLITLCSTILITLS